MKIAMCPNWGIFLSLCLKKFLMASHFIDCRISNTSLQQLMLEYLILNQKYQSASKYQNSSQRSFKEDLLFNFNKGKRTQFFEVFHLLRKEQKLQFFLRVYFYIFNIHPNLKAKKQNLEQQVKGFKEYLNNKGSQLAKTNQFLEFYALPFVKNPATHASYKTLFTKQWINNLTTKLQQFLEQQEKRMRYQVQNFTKQKEASERQMSPFFNNPNLNSASFKEIEERNEKLIKEIQLFKTKYSILQENNQAMIQSFNAHIMESQSKWFSIVKQLTNSSKDMISLIMSSGSNIAHNRKFMKIKKTTERYEKFIKKEIVDLMSQSQDISIFDKASVNQVSQSASFTNISHKNAVTYLKIDEYLPIDYLPLLKEFKCMNNESKRRILQGISWRIIKSSDKGVRRQTIVGLIINDVLGFMSGDVIEILKNNEICTAMLELLMLISEDNYGRKVIFRNAGLYKDLIQMIPTLLQQKKYKNLQYVIIILQKFNNKKDMLIQLLNLNIIQIYMYLFQDPVILSHEDILESILSLMVSLASINQGLDVYQNEINIFFTLSQVYKCDSNLARSLILGIIYALLGRESLWQLAQQAKVPQFIHNLYLNDETISKPAIKSVISRLQNYQPADNDDNAMEEESLDDDLMEEIFDRREEEIQDLDQYIKGHQILSAKYYLKNRIASQQLQEINKCIKAFQKKKSETIIERKLEYEQVISFNKQTKPSVKLPSIKQKQQHANYDSNAYKGQEHHVKQNRTKTNNPSQNQKDYYSMKVLEKEQKPQYKIKESVEPKESKIKKREVSQQKKQPSPHRKVSAEKPEYRIKKSSSVDKGLGVHQKLPRQRIGNNISNVQDYKSIKQNEIKSPPPKKSKEEILKKLNEELQSEWKAQNSAQSKKIADNRISSRQNVPLRQNNFVGETEELNAFCPKPKIRRTPPKDDD